MQFRRRALLSAPGLSPGGGPILQRGVLQDLLRKAQTTQTALLTVEQWL
jgi:hypothetical protein